jgi:DNA-binding CsgD family transcriptional regulator/tetratricopeptide (TPR) repeat protein
MLWAEVRVTAMGQALEQGQEAFAGRRWREAFDNLRLADGEHALSAPDREHLATAAYLLGEEAVWRAEWTRAFQQHLDEGELPEALRCGFWLAFGFLNLGEMARASGWIARSQRLIEEQRLDCAACGYLMLPEAIERVDDAPEIGRGLFARIAEIGERFSDRDLIALGRHGEGRALIRLGETAAGMALLDEVLIAITSGELSPIVVGDVYCSIIEACHEVFDVARGREWTAALSEWMSSNPEIQPFRGQCLVYRSAVLQMHGSWPDAMAEAVQACQRLSEPTPHPAAGAAYYQRAEIERLRGEFAAAEESYRLAARFGRDPQPGLALLRLAEGKAAAGAPGLRRALVEAKDNIARLKLLPAHVEVLLATGDVAAAREATDELVAIAATMRSPHLEATAAHAQARVLHAEGEAAAALGCARKARDGWVALDAPYQAAQARGMIGVICRELGDTEACAIELEAARRDFERLGATPDAARLGRLVGDREGVNGLTPRELDILRLVATGKTNRAIGDELVISEKTVARHISNIFDKLGVSSRTAATAYAYDHGLVHRPA